MEAGGQLIPGGGPPGQGDGGGLELVLGDGKVHAYKGQFVFATFFGEYLQRLRDADLDQVTAITMATIGRLMKSGPRSTALAGGRRLGLPGIDRHRGWRRCRCRTSPPDPGLERARRRQGRQADHGRAQGSLPGRGLDYRVTLDTTRPVTEGIREILETILIAMLLVTLVVFVFLQNWRATLIPMIAVPVSLIGTFAVFPLLGFSINTLSLFGLVLAIGLVVDDAIVVVEAVQHHIEEGMSPRDATVRAMKEVSSPVVAIALVLSAVFIPMAFIGGIQGLLNTQFAVTIAISVVISAFNALSLSPALSAMLLRPRRQSRGPLARLFGLFNRSLAWGTRGYVRVSHGLIRKVALGVAVLLAFTVADGLMGKKLPSSFLPEEDQGYMLLNVSLPPAASLERTDAAARKVEKILASTEGVVNFNAVIDFSLLTRVTATYNAFFFVQLDAWDERESPELQAKALSAAINKRLATEVPEANAFAFLPPSIPGLGTSGGFSLWLQDRSGGGVDFLDQNLQRFLAAARKRPELTGVNSGFTAAVPQVFADVDRDKALVLGVDIREVYQTLQAKVAAARGQMRRVVSLLVAGLVSGGCMVGPDYERPTVETRGAFRGATEVRRQSLGDKRWSQVFQDPTLQQLIASALEQNLDVGIAAARIVQAEAQLGITRADQLPTLGAGASAARQRLPEAGQMPATEVSSFELNATASWQIDFWGKFRRASEAARAELLAAHWGRRAVITTLVADLAASYFQLRELDLEVEITRRTVVTRRESLELVRLQERQGSVSLLDVRQAEQLVYVAAQTIISLERRIAQQENAIRVLLGSNPGPVARGRKLVEQPHEAVVPAGIPSTLLQRRPDIRVAEERLIAANARIGVARAAYFPDIALTATGGFQSNALADLLSAPARLWTVAASLTQTIFAGGRVRAGVRLSEAQQRETLLVYRQTILQAFREVSDALVAYGKNREFRAQQQLLTGSAREARQLSDQRYRGGTASYLEVLDSDTRYFTAELGLAQAQLDELLALVQLYRALGGGWQ